MCDLAREWTGDPVPSDCGIMGKPGELAYAVLQGASLIEPRRLPGEWHGRNQGVSIPVYKGVRYRVGGTKGTFQQGAEVPTPIDTGTVLISDQRVVFAGDKASREWLYPKLIGFRHDPLTLPGPQSRCRIAKRCPGSPTPRTPRSWCVSASSWR